MATEGIQEVQERRFCDAKGNVIIFNMIEILKTIKSQKLYVTFENIVNAFTVARDCVLGRTDSWLIDFEPKEMPLALTIPLQKKKLSEEEVSFMVKCYEESAEDDLALAKECEGLDSDFDFDSGE